MDEDRGMKPVVILVRDPPQKYLSPYAPRHRGAHVFGQCLYRSPVGMDFMRFLRL